MPEKRVHPSEEELRSFSLGQLPAQEAAKVEIHIGECEPCCETLLQLSTNDTFLALLRDTREPDDGLTIDQSEAVVIVDSGAEESVQQRLAEHPRYGIVGLIAKGGMGDVYKAEHRMMERTVALKVIRHELMRRPEAVQRFHREVKTAARLSHPNIVTAYDAEQAGDVHFLVMEYVDGVDLAHLIKDRGTLSVAKACEYIQQAAVGLQYAHEQGMVHRDIKPHNVMVTVDETVKILDFGLASLLVQSYADRGEALPERGDLTAVGTIMGTPDFISPEQASDAHQADIRSDIYSLGTTLYYLLSGRAPFAEESVTKKLKNHAIAEPDPIENIKVGVSDELAKVIRRMMAKDPANRYQTPADVASALEPFVGDFPSERNTSASTSNSLWPPGPAAMLIAGLLAIVFAGLIYVITDKGTLAIETVDESVQVRIWKVANETREPSLKLKLSFVDTVTGSKVLRLASGSYKVFLVQQDSNFRLSQDGFTLSRGGRVVVNVLERRPIGKRSRESVTETADQLQYAESGLQEVLRFEGHSSSSSESIDISSNGMRTGSDAEAIAYSPDGKWFVTGHDAIGVTNDKIDDPQRSIIRVWDARSGAVTRTLTGHRSKINGLAFSPNGKLLVSASGGGFIHGNPVAGVDYTIRIWDFAGGGQLLHHDSALSLNAVRFTNDGTRLISAAGRFGEQPELRLWKLSSNLAMESIVPETAGMKDHVGGRISTKK